MHAEEAGGGGFVAVVGTRWKELIWIVGPPPTILGRVMTSGSSMAVEVGRAARRRVGGREWERA